MAKENPWNIEGGARIPSFIQEVWGGWESAGKGGMVWIALEGWDEPKPP